MTRISGGVSHPLAGTQQRFIADQMAFPSNQWTTINRRINLPQAYSAYRARLLVLAVARWFEGIRSRVVECDGQLFQTVISPEDFLSSGFTYGASGESAGWLDPEQLTSRFVVTPLHDRTEMLVQLHHAFGDQASLGILNQAIGAFRDTGPATLASSYGDAPQPRSLFAREQSERGRRATDTWLSYHSQQDSPLGVGIAAKKGFSGVIRCTAVTGEGFVQALYAAALRLRISLASFVNGLICGFLGELYQLRQVSLKTIFNNRTPEYRHSVASLANEVWVRTSMRGHGDPAWYKALHGALLAAYGNGIYDWTRVRLSPNFLSPYRSAQTVSTNIHTGRIAARRLSSPLPSWSAVKHAPSASTLEIPAITPACLAHDLAVDVIFRGKGEGVLVRFNAADSFAGRGQLEEMVQEFLAFALRRVETVLN